MRGKLQESVLNWCPLCSLPPPTPDTEEASTVPHKSSRSGSIWTLKEDRQPVSMSSGPAREKLYQKLTSASFYTHPQTQPPQGTQGPQWAPTQETAGEKQVSIRGGLSPGSAPVEAQGS